MVLSDAIRKTRENLEQVQGGGIVMDETAVKMFLTTLHLWEMQAFNQEFALGELREAAAKRDQITLFDPPTSVPAFPDQGEAS